MMKNDTYIFRFFYLRKMNLVNHSVIEWEADTVNEFWYRNVSSHK